MVRNLQPNSLKKYFWKNVEIFYDQQIGFNILDKSSKH